MTDIQKDRHRHATVRIGDASILGRPARELAARCC